MSETMSDLHDRIQCAIDSLGSAMFSAIYHDMYQEGLCDFVLSAEYKRVYAEWHAAGRPLNVYRFIRQHANRRPVEAAKGGAK